MSCLIKAEGLSKSYGNKRALNNINFEINKGAPIALVGPNGAGKTTLFSILCGYILPTSGNVSIFGQQPASAQNLSRLAALPQDAQLDPRFSIAAQLTFYGQLQGLNKSKAKFEAERVIELVGLKDSFNEKPGALSHGMRKRATIAQALIGSPEIVMLDEATAGLDPLHAREVRELVATLADDITFILSSHDLSELERLCEQVLYLDNGIIQQHQTHVSATKERYLTLRMEQNYAELINSLQMIASIRDVVQSQDREYTITIESNGEDNPVEIDILTLCYQQGWRYRQLVNGKTLEEQLFSKK
ncbi:ABC transporter ATP-binding protein [Colwelliaceae bacterium BS250]